MGLQPSVRRPGCGFFSNRDAKSSGEALANYVMQNFLLPVSSLPRVLPVRSAGSRLTWLLHGFLGTVYRTEGSPDLLHWFPVATNQAELHGVVMEDAADSVSVIRFYRAAPLLFR